MFSNQCLQNNVYTQQTAVAVIFELVDSLLTFINTSEPDLRIHQNRCIYWFLLAHDTQ